MAALHVDVAPLLEPSVLSVMAHVGPLRRRAEELSDLVVRCAPAEVDGDLKGRLAEFFGREHVLASAAPDGAGHLVVEFKPTARLEAAMAALRAGEWDEFIRHFSPLHRSGDSMVGATAAGVDPAADLTGAA